MSAATPAPHAPLTTATPVRSTDSLGCSAHGLHMDQELAAPGIRFYRKRTGVLSLGQVATPASDRGYLVGVSMMAGHNRRILRGPHASSHHFGHNAVYVRRFSEDYRADLHSPFDFILMEVSSRCLERAVDGRTGTRITGLECVTGLADPVLAGLAWALAPALERPKQASRLFVDQMAAVVETHLVQQYGGRATQALRRNPRLSPMLQARAKELLRSELAGDLSITEVAQACSLSRSYFIRAFKESTGETPHKWLQRQRVEVACGLLREASLPLAAIAACCGFADQSHFTRVFTRATGSTPRHWQRGA